MKTLLLLLGLFITIKGLQCPPNAMYSKRIDEFLAPFSSGITQDMIKRLGGYVNNCRLEYKDHKFINAQDCLSVR